MKKLSLLFIAIAMVCFVSFNGCKSSGTEEATATEQEETLVEEETEEMVAEEDTVAMESEEAEMEETEEAAE